MTLPLPLLTDADLVTPGTREAGLGALATAKGNLPLRALDVEATLTGLVARTVVRQRFINPFDEPLEATYIFPLPDRAAVTAFRMLVADRTVEGQLMERGQAQAAYDQAVVTGHRAALAEEERPGVFTMQVGNLMPGEQATIHLEIVGALDYAGGEAAYRFPLVVAPRYMPGAPTGRDSVGEGHAPDTDLVPDASRISPPVLLPGFPNPVRLSITVDIDPAGLVIDGIRSSLHAISSEVAGNGRRKVTIQPGERLNRDFVLRLAVATERPTSSLLFCPDADNRGGTFAVTVVPPKEQPESRRGRDLVFLLDRSGSMDGWKMVSARNAITSMVETLTDRDRFTILAFDSEIETPQALGTGLTLATGHHRLVAQAFLAQVEARGGTEMAQPLEQAVQLLTATDGERDAVLVLVTDGQVGDEDHLLKRIGSQVGRIRIFTVGIDSAVNAGFLNRLASVGRGACELVESEERLAEVMNSIHRQIGQPVRTNLRFLPEGFAVEADTIVPGRMPDLFADSPLVITGRYRGQAAGSLTLESRDTAGRVLAEHVSPTFRNGDAITRLWARGRVRELEDRYAIGVGDRRALEREIVETSLQFGVLCRFTAYVAIDGTEIVNQGGHGHRVTQAVESVDGWANSLFSMQRDFADSGVCEWQAMSHSLESLSDTVECRISTPKPLSARACRSLIRQIRVAMEAVQGDTAADRRLVLKEVTDLLVTLLDNLDALGPDAAIGDQLQAICDAMVGIRVARKADPVEVDRLWQEVAAVLEILAGPPAGKSGTRKPFWK